MAVPKKLDDESVRLFAISKLPWIKKQKKKFLSQERQSKREFVSGESHYFRGTRYLLNVIESKEKQRIEIRNKKYIDLYIRPNSTIEKREKIINEWYRYYLKQTIPAYIDKWEKLIGVSVNEFRVKCMKTKWGSCNIESKRIWINLELAKKTPRCLEYIIVHEMVHLLERHHNERFHAYMDKFMPNWRSIKAELNNMVYEEKG
ncbi:MAG: M48 family metallopeptidase [Senegalia sp. (in: firmicutes)]|uniref:M48 family metallopeptidase n=1 Tax=Senegalia sp. (in: firmicutes) TaxID=1924098 RepID=UPI003F9E5D70